MKFLRRLAHAASILAPCLLLSCASASPSPAQPQPDEPQRAQSQTDRQIGTETNPAFVRISKTKKQAADEKAEADDQSAARWATVRQTWGIMALTLALVAVGIGQVQIYRQMRDHNHVVERAYLATTHRPVGLDMLSQPMGNPPTYSALFQGLVRNNGNTPALITRTLIHPFRGGENLPSVPPYDETKARQTNVSIVKDDEFPLMGLWDFEADYIDRLRMDKRMTGPERLYVIGYVDYIDKFGVRRRTGYARLFNGSADDPELYKADDGRTFSFDKFRKRQNLGYVMTPGYNYDCKRKKGEGNDWDQKPCD